MRYWLLLAGSCLVSCEAMAGGIAGIGNATVTKDQLMLHVREVFGVDDDGRNLDNRWRQRFMADYGFTDWFASGIYVQGDRRDDKNMEFEALIWDSRVELTDVAHDGYYSGFRIRYTYRDGDKKPDNLHLRTIIGVPYKEWEFRLNQIFYTDTGLASRSGLGLDNRVQVSYGYTEGHRVGVESFLDSGNLRDVRGHERMTHTMGVVFTGAINKDLAYEAGYARGMTLPSPDHTFKLFLTQRF